MTRSNVLGFVRRKLLLPYFTSVASCSSGAAPGLIPAGEQANSVTSAEITEELARDLASTRIVFAQLGSPNRVPAGNEDAYVAYELAAGAHVGLEVSGEDGIPLRYEVYRNPKSSGAKGHGALERAVRTSSGFSLIELQAPTPARFVVKLLSSEQTVVLQMDCLSKRGSCSR